MANWTMQAKGSSGHWKTIANRRKDGNAVYASEMMAKENHAAIAAVDEEEYIVVAGYDYIDDDLDAAADDDDLAHVEGIACLSFAGKQQQQYDDQNVVRKQEKVEESDWVHWKSHHR